MTLDLNWICIVKLSVFGFGLDFEIKLLDLIWIWNTLIRSSLQCTKSWWRARHSKPIYYVGPHELCIIVGGPQNQLILSENSSFLLTIRKSDYSWLTT